MHLLRELLRNEDGFVVSAELILIATITVLALVVGLSSVSMNVNNELMDMGNAFARTNSFRSSDSSDGTQSNGSDLVGTIQTTPPQGEGW